MPFTLWALALKTQSLVWPDCHLAQERAEPQKGANSEEATPKEVAQRGQRAARAEKRHSLRAADGDDESDADEGALVRRGGRAAVRSLSALDRHVLPACDAGNQPSKISKFAKPALENLDPQPKEKSPGYAKPAANVHAIKELPGASRT